MNLERLRAVQAEEREADSLRVLPDSFYREVAEYIDELRARRADADAEADDPFGSAEVRRLSDEIETAEEVAEAIYERRVGKLVKRASLAAAGVPADEEGLTTEEAELFADLVAQIEAHRTEVLASFDGEAAGARDAHPASGDRDGGPTGRASGGRDEATAFDAGAAMGDESASPDDPEAAGTEGSGGDAPPPPPDEPLPEDDPTGEGAGPDDSDATGSTDGGLEPERVTLRIIRDVGEVFGVDERVYDLAAEDVVSLPVANAKPLLDRDAAEEIE